MKIRSLVLAIVTAISLFSPGLNQAFAQTEKEPAGFRNVSLWVYPEYDDPRLLVMLEGKITGASAPVKVRFLVPAAAEMYSAGSKDAQGKYTGGPPNRQPSTIAGWDEISYELKTETFRVEYYDPIIQGQPDKKIAYDFRWLYPISDLRVIVQQPRNATAFTVTPPGGSPTSADGFPGTLYEYRDLKDNPLHFDIAYVKSDTNPSVPTTPTSKSPTTTDTSAGLVTIVIVGVLIASGFIWILKASRKEKPGRRAARARPVPASKRAPSKGRFCARCGRPVESGARFCPYCGAKTRNSD